MLTESVARAERIRDRVEIVLASAVSLLFGATFGWSYGADNQVVYLLGALRLVRPGILARDWFATQTTHYHVAYKYLAAGLMALSSQGWAVAIAHTVVVGAGTAAVYWLLRALLERRQALVAFLLLVAVAMVERTKGPCTTYVFDHILQPSTIASAAFLVSAALFVRGRWLGAGLALGAAGLFHANFLVLLLGAAAVAHLALGRRELGRRLLWHLGPAVLVLLLFAPMILSTAGGKDAAAAQEIYAIVRAPHHFALASCKRGFMGFLAWQLLGLGAALPLGRRPQSPAARLLCLLAGMLLVIWTGTVLSANAGLRQATQLFAWRLVPHADLLLAALACAAAVKVLVEPGFGRRYGAGTFALVAGGVGVLFLDAAFGRRGATLPALTAGVLGALLVARLVEALGRRFASAGSAERARRLWARAGALVAGLAALAVLVPTSAAQIQQIYGRSSLLRGPRREEQALYAWMRASTPVDAVFLTPPDNENLRFHAERAIVVDWKSNPIVPAEVLEWYRRLGDVTGARVRSRRDLRGYGSIGEARLADLRRRYQIDFVVLGRGQGRGLRQHKVAYASGGFTVLDVRDEPSPGSS
ncbi:MAG: glycosyltransferase family 39 protein [Deltaproteobacteria bacterium]|nr:glycosyltransferase family 39 protein [Deltaproteobacteria bacterium]